MPTLFSRIVAGEIPCYKVSENEKFLAFLDISPLQKGHTLIISKQETDYIFDLEDELLAEMMVFAKSVSKKIKQNFPCKKVGVTVIGLEVPHAHIHLVPMNTANDVNFTQAKLKPSNEELENTASAIRAKLSL